VSIFPLSDFRGPPTVSDFRGPPTGLDDDGGDGHFRGRRSIHAVSCSCARVVVGTLLCACRVGYFSPRLHSGLPVTHYVCVIYIIGGRFALADGLGFFGVSFGLFGAALVQPGGLYYLSASRSRVPNPIRRGCGCIAEASFLLLLSFFHACRMQRIYAGTQERQPLSIQSPQQMILICILILILIFILY